MNIKEFNLLDEDEYKIIPINWGCTRYHTFTFEGWENICFVNELLDDILQLASASLLLFIKIYKNKYAFTQPLISWKMDGTFQLKIGILEIDIYEELKKNIKKHKCLLDIENIDTQE